MYVASQSTVCEWHQFQGLNEVIYSPYRQNFRACGGLRGNLITPSRTRPPVGARDYWYLPIVPRASVRVTVSARKRPLVRH